MCNDVVWFFLIAFWIEIILLVYLWHFVSMAGFASRKRLLISLRKIALLARAESATLIYFESAAAVLAVLFY